MRIVAGKFKSRLIKAPQGQNTGPTSDRVKESLFNILGSKVYNAICLDLFAGSGNLGLEALSRNAKKCIFVDHDLQAIRTIKENIAALQVNDQTKVLYMDYQKALRLLKEPFDLIFLDPPYRYSVLDDILKTLEEKNLLSDDAIIVYESAMHTNIDPDCYLGYEIKKYQYGDTILNLLQKKKEI